jgi:hypothetical protein
VDGGQPTYLTKLGEKKTFAFCPHKNYPFKTFFFQKLETKKHFKKFPSVFVEQLIPINNTLFPSKKKATLHLKKNPSYTDYLWPENRPLISVMSPPPTSNSTKTCWENLRRLFYWVCPKGKRGIGEHF